MKQRCTSWICSLTFCWEKEVLAKCGEPETENFWDWLRKIWSIRDAGKVQSDPPHQLNHPKIIKGLAAWTLGGSDRRLPSWWFGRLGLTRGTVCSWGSRMTWGTRWSNKPRWFPNDFKEDLRRKPSGNQCPHMWVCLKIRYPSLDGWSVDHDFHPNNSLTLPFWGILDTSHFQTPQAAGGLIFVRLLTSTPKNTWDNDQ